MSFFASPGGQSPRLPIDELPLLPLLPVDPDVVVSAPAPVPVLPVALPVVFGVLPAVLPPVLPTVLPGVPK